MNFSNTSATASNHLFFESLASQPITGEQVNRFAEQWYIAAYNHKRAFPFLVAVTDDDQTRRELIEILRDEYGNGDPTAVHALLLKGFLTQTLGLSDNHIQITQPLPEVAEFGDVTMKVWSGNNPALAFGYHYALEHIAATAHEAFYAFLKRYGYSDEELIYFKYHAAAEPEHAKMAESGYARYQESGQQAALDLGAQMGIESLTHMWDGFNSHLFH
jgi:pyrroloquinoline-quinone synthase